MDSLFPEQDLCNPESKYVKKVILTFKLIQSKNWTKEEFHRTMEEFAQKWVFNTWMPANLLEFKKKLFSDNEMII